MLQLKGGAVYIAEMAAAARGTGLLATAQATAAATSEVLAGALSLVGGRLAIIGAALAALTGVVALSVKTFAEDTEAIFRTAIVLRNLGSSMPIEQLQAFASELQRSIAIDDEAIVALGGVIARFGVAGEQIPTAIRAILDASKATGQSVEELGQTFGRALLGNTRGLRQLGIQFEATGDRAADTLRLAQQFTRLFGGAAAAQRNTPLGAFEAFKESIANLFSAIGRLFGPGVVTGLNQVIFVIDQITAALNQLADFLARLGLAAPGTPAIPQGAPGGAAALGLDDALGENTRAVKENTKAAEGIIRQAFGGPGTIGKAAGNIRALRQALGNASF